MKVAAGIALILISGALAGTPVRAQQAPPASAQAPTLTSVLDMNLGVCEFEIVATAQAMPEDKYSFAPTEGNFKGVRTFAQQVKHLATVNNRLADGIMGQAPPTAPDEGITSNGPDAIQTKDQIMQYLKDSFARMHKAIATINADNALTPLKDAPAPFLRTRMSLAMFTCTHAMDHYGQMVEYMRMNGLTPPMSAPRPQGNAPANPPGKPTGE
ncbi:MAG TPA: DinB family protein [Candidatus Acidoferrum sp.]|nr:DinB family protein [Candidatus Acidoferrum sp.]HXY79663.1 DinB family protein [Candidatus Bathyarchaeia archaeon]